MTNTRTIVIKEKRITRDTCDNCNCFSGGFLKLTIAYCSKEGRIINRGFKRIPHGFANYYFETCYPLPHWCPLPKED